MPLVLVVKLGSKIFSFKSEGMPTPLSLISIIACLIVFLTLTTISGFEISLVA